MTAGFPQSSAATHVLRCVHCRAVQTKADPNFRCAQCSELLEVVYPEWQGASREFGLRLKKIWKERRTSRLPEDVSGVWRYRELLPQLERHHIVTMSEGNTGNNNNSLMYLYYMHPITMNKYLFKHSLSF